jgi:hypothetical protein
MLRGCSMATSILHCQNFRFQITIYLAGNGEFLAYIHIHLCTELGFKLKYMYFFFKKIFWKQIRIDLLLEYNWYEVAVFTKQKHVILTWGNSLKYSAWLLSFPLSCKWCYNEEILKIWRYPTMDDSARDFLCQT